MKFCARVRKIQKLKQMLWFNLRAKMTQSWIWGCNQWFFLLLLISQTTYCQYEKRNRLKNYFSLNIFLNSKQCLHIGSVVSPPVPNPKDRGETDASARTCLVFLIKTRSNLMNCLKNSCSLTSFCTFFVKKKTSQIWTVLLPCDKYT